MLKRFRGPRIFCIGFNKTGTTSLHHYFRAAGLKSYHKPRWTFMTHLPRARPYFLRYQCYSDGEMPNMRRLHDWFPGAVFIFNDRDERDWLRSRVKHLLRHRPLQDPAAERAYQLSRMTQDFSTDPDLALSRWIFDYRLYRAQALSYFSDNPRFLHLYVTEDTTWPQRLGAHLSAAGVTHNANPAPTQPHANARAPKDVTQSDELQRNFTRIDQALARANG